MKHYKRIALILILIAFTGCTHYRTNSEIEFDSLNVNGMKPSIPVGTVSVERHKYTVIEKVTAIVKKLFVFNPDPTKEQVDIVLAEKGKEKGADAVINVNYVSGVGMDTWGYIEATGDAIKIDKSNTPVK